VTSPRQRVAAWVLLRPVCFPGRRSVHVSEAKEAAKSGMKYMSLLFQLLGLGGAFILFVSGYPTSAVAFWLIVGFGYWHVKAVLESKEKSQPVPEPQYRAPAPSPTAARPRRNSPPPSNGNATAPANVVVPQVLQPPTTAVTATRLSLGQQQQLAAIGGGNAPTLGGPQVPSTTRTQGQAHTPRDQGSAPRKVTRSSGHVQRSEVKPAGGGPRTAAS